MVCVPRRSIRVLFFALFLSLFAFSGYAATLTVTKVADTADGVCDADCSLREAVVAAASGDTVVFSSLFSTPQTINLSTGQIIINKNLTITGPGANLLTVANTKAASINSRVFSIVTFTVFMNGLTITGGNVSGASGGGILSVGATLVLSGCDVVGNTTTDFGGGISSSGNLNLTNSTFRGNRSGNVGGVNQTVGSLTITGSTISGNIATNQAGGLQIDNVQTTSITNSTISGNSCGSQGGGILWSGTGAGPYFLTITNSTVANNSAGPEGNSSGGGGMSVFSQAGPNPVMAAQLKNTLFAANTPTNFKIDLDQGSANSSYASLGNNLDSDGTSGFTNGVGGNIVGTPGNPTNARLAPLAVYGGATATHLLFLGSPALNAGTASGAPAADQRGVTRPQQASVDIGAVEMAPFIVTNTNDAGAGSLRQAISDANAAAGLNDILLNLSAGPQTINLAGVLPALADSVTIINATGANNLTVRRNSGGDYRIFNVQGGITASISGLKIANGKTAGATQAEQDGGGIINSGSLTLTNCIVSENRAVPGFGGGVRNTVTGQMTINNCEISGNTADNGSGIASTGLWSMSNSTVSGNTAIFQAAINSLRATAVITNSTISGNTAGSWPGGILNAASNLAQIAADMTLTSCTVTGNTSTTNTIGNIVTINNSGLSAVTTLRNTLVTANIGPNFTTSNGASLLSSGFNLDSDGTSGFTNGAGGDIAGTSSAPINARLGPLSNYGGSTNTHILQFGSPAINTGDATGSPATDQRGVTRPPAGFADIGAVEMSLFVVTNTNDAGTGSLRQAMSNANVVPGLNDIVFSLPSGPQIINLASALPIPTDNVNIANATGANNLTVRRNTGGDYLVFETNPGTSVSFQGLTISNGKSTFGGGIRNAGNLTISQCAISGNTSTGNGGGIVNNGGNLTITQSTISGNTGFDGGGLLNQGGGAGANTTLISTTISGNTATSFTGGVSNLNLAGPVATNLTLINCTVTGNTGPTEGGVATIDNNGSAVAITILRNTIVGGNSNPNLIRLGTSANVVSNGYNLASDNGAGLFTGTGDQINANPLLGPLTNNGGPTLTHAFTSLASPAIDKGSSIGVGTDQRGFSRTFDFSTILTANGGDNSDIGAFEAQGRDGDINRSDPSLADSSDNIVDLKDIQWYDNFVNGTFIPATGGAAQPLPVGPSALENHKRDIAPLAIAGEGCLNASDRQQMTLFALFISTPSPAGGPVVLNLCPQPKSGDWMSFRGSPEREAVIDASVIRTVRLVSMESSRAGGATIGVEMDTAGDETRAMFTLEFATGEIDIQHASFPADNLDVTLGEGAPAGSTLAVNAGVAGRLIVLLNFNGPIPSGLNRRLVNVNFHAVGDATIRPAKISLAEFPAARQIVNGSGEELSAIYKDIAYFEPSRKIRN